MFAQLSIRCLKVQSTSKVHKLLVQNSVYSVHHFIILYKLKHVLEIPDCDLNVFQFKSLVFCFVFLSHR